MTWTRLSDNFDGLSIDLSDAAFRTHVLALVWSNRTLSNGRLPKRALGLVNGTPKIANELVAAGWWTSVEGGWQVDWTDQEQAEQVQARKSRNAEANRAYRERRDRHAVGDHSRCDPKHCDASGDSARDASRDASPSASVRDTLPDPTLPDPSIGDIREKSLARSVKPVVVDEVEQSFERAWKSWPKKVEKQKAITKYSKAAKLRRDLPALEADVIRFGKAYAISATETRFVPGLASWLDGQRWNDDLPTPQLRPMTRTEQNLAFVAKLAAEEQGAPETRRPTRDDENMAVVRRLEARERDQRPTRGQEHLAYIASLGTGSCAPGHHKLTIDGTCAVCTTPASQIATENPF